MLLRRVNDIQRRSGYLIYFVVSLLMVITILQSEFKLLAVFSFECTVYVLTYSLFYVVGIKKYQF